MQSGLFFWKDKELSEFIDFDPHTGISHWWDYDAQTDKATISTQQDIEPILEWNKNAANQGLTDKGIKESWWKYATIPNIIIEKWMNEYGVNIYNKDHQKKVFNLLNRPEYKYLKTTTKMHWG